MYEEDDCRPDWFVRDNPEIDEKLPHMAKEAVCRGIDFTQLVTDDEDIDGAVVAGMLSVLQEHLECFENLTADEIEYFLELLSTACELVILVEEGVLEERDGKLHVPD